MDLFNLTHMLKTNLIKIININNKIINFTKIQIFRLTISHLETIKEVKIRVLLINLNQKISMIIIISQCI